MHVRKVRLCSFLLLLLVSSGALQAMPERQSPQSAVQINQDVERIFQRAVSHYKSGQYDVVEYELQGLLNIYPLNHRTTAIYYLIGRAQYKQKKFGQARETLERLIKNFPTSAYVDDALYLLAAIDFEQQMYEDCAKKLLTVLNKTDDLRLRDRVRNLLFPLLTDYIPLEKLRALRQEFRTGPAAADLDLALAVQEFRAGKRDAAKNLLKAWLSSNPAHPLKDVAENFLARASQVRPKKIRVGVVLPLTGYFKQEAQSLLDGIRYALLEDPSARQLGLELLVRDSQGDMLQTIRTAKELVNTEHVDAIIGELESDKTAVIGALAAREGVPVIAPTAKEVGLASLEDNIFQMLPDIAVRGEKIAEYAINEMNLQSFAILAPADKYGKNMADSFAQTVDRLHGTIVAETWYYEQATDVRDQFSYIRKLGLRKMIQDSILAENPGLPKGTVDSLVAAVEAEKRQALLQNEENRPLKLSDSTAVPVTSIDGVFLPVYTEDISYVAPQFALYNIQAQLLGGEFWNDEETLDKNSRYVSGVVFPSDYYADPTDRAYIRFRNRFRTKMGKTPEKLEIIGYDTMRFLLSVIKKGAGDRQAILSGLRNVRVFQGLLHPYRFDEKPRVNSFLHILQYQNNAIYKLK